MHAKWLKIHFTDEVASISFGGCRPGRELITTIQKAVARSSPSTTNDAPIRLDESLPEQWYYHLKN